MNNEQNREEVQVIKNFPNHTAMAAMIACLYMTAAPIGAQADDCKIGLLERLPGAYQGQARGWTSTITVDSISRESCTVQATYTNLLRGNATETGKLRLRLDDGALFGKWANGRDQGEVRFQVTKNGRHWNGRVSGINGRPSGPWDLRRSNNASG